MKINIRKAPARRNGSSALGTSAKAAATSSGVAMRCTVART